MDLQRSFKPTAHRHLLLLSLICFVILSAIAVQQVSGGAFQLPLQHVEPEEGEDLRQCLDCHDSVESDLPFERFSHDLFFAERHAGSARGHESVCAMCHQQSFCSDCHGLRPGLKPSLKNSTDSRRRMPHRGDYVTRHRIDGHIDPTACFRCHGNPKSAKICASCHH